MNRIRIFSATVLAVALCTTVARTAPEVAPAPRLHIDVSGFKTPATATKANPKEFKLSAATSTTAAGYLGVVIADIKGKAVIEVVAPDSPAEIAGVKDGDIVVQVDGKGVATAAEARDVLRGKLAGEVVKLSVTRGDTTLDLSAKLKPTTKPMTLTSATTGRAVLGVTLGDAGPNGGVRLDDITTGGAAERAGLKLGDVILKIDGQKIDGAAGFRDHVVNKSPGDRLDLYVERGEKLLEMRAVLEAEQTGAGGPGGRGGRFGRGGAGGWDDRIPRAWRKATYRLAILGIEYTDVKHNDKIADENWEESMFSIGTYNGESATGQKVFGSMNDYYQELSHDTFKIDGKFIGWVKVSKKRMDYTTGSGTSNAEKRALLTESLEVYTRKHGKKSLDDYDGIFFLYAGGRVQTTRGGLYWPHRASIRFGDRSIPYFIVQEGGSRMTDISVFCHEFGHMLGLPDLYARPEQPGSEGVWQWCAMSNQIGNGRPQHFCAWSKEQLGWVKPTVIDPRAKQKLILSAIEDDPTQCFKVMVRADGTEYFLLENRTRKGWDSQLPGEGLLVWRVVNNKPILEESHGVEGARGPSVFPASVPFPSAANNSFTPYTIPSIKSQLGGGLPVWITNIRKLPDGRITFHIGYEYQ
ncbi:MAG TPA: M6 family metalloprotease domain-containing protein [Gemmata sp.]|nr:M6 family metalloprotease domain-containing protein [Gemmata sp.]